MVKLTEHVIFVSTDRLKDNSSELLMSLISKPDIREQVVVLTNLGDDIGWYDDYNEYFTGLICNKDENNKTPLVDRLTVL